MVCIIVLFVGGCCSQFAKIYELCPNLPSGRATVYIHTLHFNRLFVHIPPMICYSCQLIVWLCGLWFNRVLFVTRKTSRCWVNVISEPTPSQWRIHSLRVALSSIDQLFRVSHSIESISWLSINAQVYWETDCIVVRLIWNKKLIF